MPQAATRHPSRDQLSAFDQGRLGFDEFASVEAHVACCTSCCEMLEHVGDDPFVTRIREVVDGDTSIADAGQTPLPVETGWPDGVAPMDTPVPPSLVEHPRYRITGELGRGGMGVVYRAEHRLMNRSVALKVINPHRLDHPAAILRFKREVEAMAGLQHPNIVAAYDAEEAGGVVFLVMELVDGDDLAKLIKAQHPLPIATILDLTRQAAAALQHAHERGKVHRDIKPHNLLVTRDGVLKVTDFGLARCLAVGSVSTAFTDDQAIMGTPDYLAPEQARDSHTADIRADLYSLGCTLYHALAGRSAFGGKTLTDMLLAHQTDRPAALYHFRSDIPPELADIVTRLMAKDPADRYQTPQELIEALDASASGVASAPRANAPREKVAAPRMTFSGRLRDPARLIAMIIAAALVPLLLIAGYAVYTIVTEQGTVEIRSFDPKITVTVKQNGNQIKVLDPTSGSHFSLDFGSYELALQAGVEAVLEEDKLTLTRANKGAIVTVRRKEKVSPPPPVPDPDKKPLPLPQLPDTVALGPEFRVNATREGRHTRPQVAMDREGNGVVIWDWEHPVGTWSVLAQRIASSGKLAGKEIVVWGPVKGNSAEPSVAMGPSGNFIVALAGEGSQGHGVYAIPFTKTGDRVAAPLAISTSPDQTCNSPHIAADAADGFLVVWTHNVGGDHNLFAQRLNFDGKPNARAFPVNQQRDGTQAHGFGAFASAGSFIIAWSSAENIGTLPHARMVAQLFNADGTRRGQELQLAVADRRDQSIVAAAWSGSSFAICWVAGLGKAAALLVRRVTPEGTVLEAEEQRVVVVQASYENDFVAQSLASTGGPAVFVWPNRATADVLAQPYSSTGQPSASPFSVATSFEGERRKPTVAMAGTGQTLIAWEAVRPADHAGIFARVLQPAFVNP